MRVHCGDLTHHNTLKLLSQLSNTVDLTAGHGKQIGQIFFEELELPVVAKTPKGQPSTNEDVLQELAEKYALPQLVLDYRSLAKLKSTYTDKLPEQIDPDTGRVTILRFVAAQDCGRAIHPDYVEQYPDYDHDGIADIVNIGDGNMNESLDPSNPLKGPKLNFTPL